MIDDLIQLAHNDAVARVAKAGQRFKGFLVNKNTAIVANKMLELFRNNTTDYWSLFNNVSDNLNSVEGLEGASSFLGNYIDDAYFKLEIDERGHPTVTYANDEDDYLTDDVLIRTIDEVMERERKRQARSDRIEAHIASLNKVPGIQ